jgi:hypothetical protein
MILIWLEIVSGEYESGEYRIVHDEGGWHLYVDGKIRGVYATLREAKWEANLLAESEDSNLPLEYVEGDEDGEGGDEEILDLQEWGSFTTDVATCFTRFPCMIIAETGTGRHHLSDVHPRLDLGRFGTLRDATEAAHCYMMGILTGSAA